MVVLATLSGTSLLRTQKANPRNFFISTTRSAISLGKEVGRALCFPGQSSLLLWAPALAARLNLPVLLVHISLPLQAHGAGSGWGNYSE